MVDNISDNSSVDSLFDDLGSPYNVHYQHSGFLGSYVDMPGMSVLELIRAKERRENINTGMDMRSYPKRHTTLKMERPKAELQYYYRAPTPTQGPLYFPPLPRDPSPEPLSSVCCGKKDSVLSLLIRCLVPCLPVKK